MRRILMNYARDRQRMKRGGDAIQVSLSEVDLVSGTKASELLALDEALDRLSTIDERKAKVVEFRYFGGLSVEETAEVLKVSSITVTRDWNMAKAWLARELENGKLRTGIKSKTCFTRPWPWTRGSDLIISDRLALEMNRYRKKLNR